MKTYKVTAQEGVDFCAREGLDAPEVGDVVSLNLDDDKERAVIAAGWVEHASAAKTKDKE